MWTRLVMALALTFSVACDNEPAPDVDAGTDAGDTPGTDAGEDAGPPEPACTDYCAAIMAACTDANAQFEDAEQCEANCLLSGMPTGAAGDTDGNSIGCRATHAALAATDPATHCAHAGASGGNTCGTWCENYCAYTGESCSTLYADDAACMTACAAFDDTGPVNARTGDSVQCRITLGALAAADDTACAHAAEDGGAVCRDPYSCAEYCGTVTATCTGANAHYADVDTCMAYCETAAAWDAGFAGELDTNTISCRTLHAGLAAADADAHCPHASPAGGGVCGTWCDVYCDITANNCTGGNELFATAEECATACALYADTGAPGDTSGDTVQCRIYHAGLALGGVAATHCGHADTDGGGAGGPCAP